MKNIIIFLFLLSVNAYAQIELPLINPGDEIVKHSAYTLKYNEKHEQADWVAYKLDKSYLLTNNPAKRNNAFKPDPMVPTKSADSQDYSKSGYDRGHLCPSADFKADQKLMDETFYMSNMTPMRHPFNAGIWEDLENRERKWTIENQEIYVVTGPVLKDEPTEFIGRKNRVAVAKRFYKIILDYKEPELKMVAFVIPHDASPGDISAYAMTVRDAERITGFDFFSSLPHDVQDKLETELDLQKWGLNSNTVKYNQEVGTPATLEDKLIEAVQNPPQQPDKRNDQIILFIAIGLGLLVIMGGVVIFIGIRMNRKK